MKQITRHSIQPWVIAGFMVMLGSLLVALAWLWWMLGYSQVKPYSQTGVFLGEHLQMPVKMSEAKGIKVLHFWRQDCPCNEDVLAHIKKLSKHPKLKEVSYFSQSAEQGTGLPDEFKPVFLIPNGRIQGVESFPKTPSVAIWDKSNRLIYAGPYNEGITCSSDTSFIEPILKAASQDESTTLSSGGAVGCYCDNPLSTAQSK